MIMAFNYLNPVSCHLIHSCYAVLHDGDQEEELSLIQPSLGFFPTNLYLDINHHCQYLSLFGWGSFNLNILKVR